MLIYLVYLIRNLVNGKLYIGQTTKTLRQRWNQHLSSARRGSHDPLHKAIRKYGPEAFKICEIQKAGSIQELDDLEKHFIALHKTYPPQLGFGYNLTMGGQGVRVEHLSERHKKRLRKALKKRKLSASHKQHIQEGMRGYKPSATHIENVKIATTSLWKDPKFRRKASRGIRASWTPERRAAQARRMTGHTYGKKNFDKPCECGRMIRFHSKRCRSCAALHRHQIGHFDKNLVQ